VKRTNTCVAAHTRSFRGPFSARRSERWWRKHDLCPDLGPKVYYDEIAGFRIRITEHRPKERA
jgi:hypothetical protein